MGRRFPLSGLFAALMALMAQLGLGAVVPRVDVAVAAETLCHSDDGTAPDQNKQHPLDCLACPLCAALHAGAHIVVPASPDLWVPPVPPVRRAGLPPPATAPPVPWHPPQQPRAPPLDA